MITKKSSKINLKKSIIIEIETKNYLKKIRQDYTNIIITIFEND